jgi:hypothetical protein
MFLSISCLTRRTQVESTFDFPIKIDHFPWCLPWLFQIKINHEVPIHFTQGQLGQLPNFLSSSNFLRSIADQVSDWKIDQFTNTEGLAGPLCLFLLKISSEFSDHVRSSLNFSWIPETWPFNMAPAAGSDLLDLSKTRIKGPLTVLLS